MRAAAGRPSAAAAAEGDACGGGEGSGSGIPAGTSNVSSSRD